MRKFMHESTIFERKKTMTTRHLLVLLFGLIGLNSLPAFADTEEIYRFERMWPVLPQPWYFEEIWDLAISQQGHVYLADRGNNRVQKLTKEGHLITDFGTFDDNLIPIEIAVDSEENIYVSYAGVLVFDHIVYLVRKFNAHGELISDQWKKYAQCSDNIGHIAVDQQDNVYLTCASKKGQAFIHKLTSDGQWLQKWPIHSDGDLAIDQNHVYLLDRSNNRVYKYTLSGESVTDWTAVETETSDLVYKTQDIAIDSDGYIYVTDSFNRIQKFSSEGNKITEWRDELNVGGTFQILEQTSPKVWQVLKPIFSTANIEDFFSTPIHENTVEEFCFTYRIDNRCSNVWQVLEAMFEYESSFPTTIAIGPQDHILVGYNKMTPSVKKYSPEGQLMNQWASGSNLNTHMLAQYLMPLINSQWASSSADQANKPFEFHQPFDIAQDSSGKLYVTDEQGHRVLKFTAQGELIKQWGEWGEGEGQFQEPNGIAIDSKDNIYIVDFGNCRVQKFGTDGQFIEQWGGQCVGGNDSLSPTNIAVDNNDHVYVIDVAAVQIKKFTSEGDLILAFGVPAFD
jgi:tripartite motif-containing protein 71